jgi:hypothetical protein
VVARAWTGSVGNTIAATVGVEDAGPIAVGFADGASITVDGAVGVAPSAAILVGRAVKLEAGAVAGWCSASASDRLPITSVTETMAYKRPDAS